MGTGLLSKSKVELLATLLAVATAQLTLLLALLKEPNTKAPAPVMSILRQQAKSNRRINTTACNLSLFQAGNARTRTQVWTPCASQPQPACTAAGRTYNMVAPCDNRAVWCIALPAESHVSGRRIAYVRDHRDGRLCRHPCEVGVT